MRVVGRHPAFLFFFSSPTHSFSAPSKSLAKGTLRGTIGLDVSYFLFLREGGTNSNNNNSYNNKNKKGESGGRGTNMFSLRLFTRP